jgi:hypothetical protein
MKKKALTPQETRKNLSDLVAIILSGLNEEDGIIKEGIGESQFSGTEMYKVMYQLSKEFPDFLPHYFATVVGGVPYSDELEDVMFILGAFKIMQMGMSWRESIITISGEMKSVILDVLKEKYNEEDLRTFVPLVARFYELTGG